MGELVFTSLTKEAFPIIRYRTRDLTRLLPGTARSMRRMEKVTGRSDDMIILRGVNVFPTQIEEQLMAFRPRPAFPDRTDAGGADGRDDGAC
jgi:phenylacetate-CoA ligase